MSGPALCGLSLPDAPQVWAALGFEVTDRQTCQLGATRLQFGAPLGWTLSGSGPAQIDGLATNWTKSPVTTPTRPHPNTALHVDHVVISTDDTARTRSAFEDVGMQLRRERVLGERQQLFFRHGEAIIEVVGPMPGGPTRIWGLTITVADLDQTARLLGPLLGEPRAAVQPGRRIATVRPDAALSVALAVMTP